MTSLTLEYIDIHTHILPGVDDGPRTLAESAALAKCYSDLGIRKIVATSHFIPGTAWAASKQQVIDKIAEVTAYFTANDIPLIVFPGMEIAYHKKLKEKLEDGSILPLGKSQWYLIEPSFSDPADALLQTLEDLLDRGWKIILAHPERIPAIQEMGNPFGYLVQHGLRIQVNTGSLLGKFGKISKCIGLNFINRGWVHYLASDAHGAESRRPPTVDHWLEMERLLGAEVLEQLCCINPAQLLEESNFE